MDIPPELPHQHHESLIPQSVAHSESDYATSPSQAELSSDSSYYNTFRSHASNMGRTFSNSSQEVVTNPSTPDNSHPLHPYPGIPSQFTADQQTAAIQDGYLPMYDQYGGVIMSETHEVIDRSRQHDVEQVVEISPNGRYARLNTLLGRGAHKVVYKAIDREEGYEVAWNSMQTTRQEYKELGHEIEILKSVRHPNIITFHDAWYQECEYVFITELMTSGTLREYIRKLSLPNTKIVKRWARQILKGLVYLHSHEPPIVHRDIKCDNIFINGAHGEVKIGDMGTAEMKLGKKYTVIGTPEFMAPEMYEENGYSEKADIYAFGMCLLEMVTGEYPYSECQNAAQVYKKVTNGLKPKCLAKVHDPEVLELIGACLVEENERLSAAELLQHSFLAVEPEVILLAANPGNKQASFQVSFKGSDKLSVKFDFNVETDTAEDVVREMIEERVLPERYQHLITGEINRILRELNKDPNADHNKEEDRMIWRREHDIRSELDKARRDVLLWEGRCREVEKRLVASEHRYVINEERLKQAEESFTPFSRSRSRSRSPHSYMDDEDGGITPQSRLSSSQSISQSRKPSMTTSLEPLPTGDSAIPENSDTSVSNYHDDVNINGTAMDAGHPPDGNLHGKLMNTVLAAYTDDTPIERRVDHGTKEQESPVEIDEKKTAPLFTKQDKRTSAVVLSVLTVLSFITRFYRIAQPPEVVFDEVHFGKFASYYIRRTYFFDVHPPLAKLMLAAVGWLVGYDGHFLFDEIGEDYIVNQVPHVALRGLPALLGSLFVPLVYLIIRASGYPIITATVAATLVLFDNALIAQTRLILLDSMLVFFMLCCIYSYIRFYRMRYREFTFEWWGWLISSGVFMALTTSVKMVGLFLVATIGIAVLVDLWTLLDIRRGLTVRRFKQHFKARAFAFIILPIAIYLFWFWVHFKILDTSGPGDAFMSPQFQETLKGNSMLLNALDLQYGDVVNIKHVNTNAYLHSHLENYPLRYEDGRISSQGQMITGYPFNDSNNNWRIHPREPLSVDLPVDAPERFVKNGDVLQLEHLNTQSMLLTHDVASPLMATNTEFTTMPKNDTSRVYEQLFRVEIHAGAEGEHIKSVASYIRFVHLDTGVAMWTHQDKPLPEWGHGQQEVNGNKNVLDRTNLWFVSDVVGKNATEINAHKHKSVREMNFLSKFLELQAAMLSHNAALTSSHPYSSDPISWPFLLKGISFWTQNSTRRQIYLLGNPIGWWLAAGSLAVFAGVTLADAIARRRGMDAIDDVVRSRLLNSTGFFVIAWALHYAPFFLMGRQLFLHHYLPALIFSYMVYATIFNFMFVDGVDYPCSSEVLTSPVNARLRQSIWPRQQARVSAKTYAVAALLVTIHFASFWFFSPLTYGTVTLDVPVMVMVLLKLMFEH
ncbi:hypothetical protein BZG36_03562 [Bifiguratus adelaidae]|uniref:dolichyl-phosphate-mannose--protein mannosyltransferase n=1 Tax=Bifiguratus adelaidae TaxID=1938954 RepID=A0A261Y0M9_9FUNG|nr:hypothetical protein BZG36_03562 [Bifiguratus adelaidae]